MTNPDDPRSWLLKADADLLCVGNEINSPKTPWDIVCYHARQAAEKALKAWLVSKNVVPPRTHDLLILLKLAAEADLDLPDLEEVCLALRPYAI